MKTKRGHIPCLDGLRALSIILVLVGHAYGTVPVHTRISDLVNRFVGDADLGVISFFVISGYLITRLLRNEQEANGVIYLRGFYTRRVLRIFPAFYSYITVILILTGWGVIATAPSSTLCAATFSLNYGKFLYAGQQSGKHFWFVGHFWTLALEEQFYLLWPLTLVLAGLTKARRAAVGLILLCPLLRIATYFFWPEGRTQTAMMLPTAADSMMAGAALALYEGTEGFEALLKRFSLGTAALVAAIASFVVSPLLHAKFAGTYDLPVGRTINAISIAIIILYATRQPESPAGRILSSRALAFIGVLSYSLYVWQQLFLTPLNTTWTGKCPLNLALCLAVALVSYFLIERPFLRLKDRIPRDRRIRCAPAADHSLEVRTVELPSVKSDPTP